MQKRNAPNRSQGREEKMRAASFFAFLAPAVKRPFVVLAVHEVAATLMAFLLRVLRLGAA